MAFVAVEALVDRIGKVVGRINGRTAEGLTAAQTMVTVQGL